MGEPTDPSTVRGLVATLRSGELQPREAVEAAIRRIESHDGHIHSVVIALFDRALDRLRRTEKRTQPLSGVPVLLKDAGEELVHTPHYCGLASLRDSGHRSVRTTPLAQHYERLGLSIVGRSSCPPFSAGVTTEPPGFPATRNPVLADRSVGGSSGGSAAAVAAGLVPFAHGSDATGSLRFPAACCGLATIVPTRGLAVPAGTTPAGQPDPGRVWRSFVLTNDVADLAFLLPFFVRDAAGPPPAAPDPTRRLRIGFLVDDVALGMPVDRQCRRAVETAAGALERLGHEVVAAHPAALNGLLPRVSDPLARWTHWARQEQLAWLAERLDRPVGACDVPDDDLVLQALSSPRADPLRTIHDAREVAVAAEAMLPWWDSFDVLLTPTMRTPPWTIGGPAGILQVGGFAAPFSFTGQPALVMPVPSADGDAAGSVQLVGARGGDEGLLRLGMQLEQAW